MTKEELRACPFCGQKEAILDEFYMDTRDEANISRQISIRCGYCGITFFTDDKKAEMIKAWNTRANLDVESNAKGLVDCGCGMGTSCHAIREEWINRHCTCHLGNKDCDLHDKPFSEKIMKLVKDHYWDSFEQDKEIIFIHLENILGLFRKQ